jgi:alkylation response protein AidB-like acyl-CoA dehydrogenase
LQTGFTVILVERSEGVETKPIKTSYSSSAGTAYITFDNVKVPVENTLGPEGGGIFVILSCVSFSTSRKRLLTQLYSNFNHERWVMCTSSARGQRLIVEECLKFVHSFPFKYFFLSLANLPFVRWVNQRKAFGKPLSSQAVIRSKIAAMISRTESVQNWLENLTLQMCNMVCSFPSLKYLFGTCTDVCRRHTRNRRRSLRGMFFLVHHRGVLSHAMFRRPIGLLKMYATRCAQETAADAVQIFGGRGITKTGMGQYIEHVRLIASCYPEG